MSKLLIVLLLIFFSNSVTAQEINALDALSRMERNINDLQEEFSMPDKYFLGRTVAAHIIGNYNIYTENPALTEYLNLICRALAINSMHPDWYDGYYVTILDDYTLNAFSTPGGHIFITRGLIEITTSEDMIAAIIAHELAHIQLQHGISEITHDRLVNSLGQERDRIRQNLSNDRYTEFTDFIDKIADNLLNKGYSQTLEFEADNMAYSLLISTGYNPDSLIDLLRILDGLSINQRVSLNQSHPLPSQRIAVLQRQNVTHVMDNSSVRQDRFNRIMER